MYESEEEGKRKGHTKARKERETKERRTKNPRKRMKVRNMEMTIETAMKVM